MRLSGLGRIVAQQVQIDDLQGQLDELGKRETGLRGQIARLGARLAATNLDAATRATLEARRAAAQRDLAQVRGARTQVNGEARYATIQLTLQTEQSSLVPASPSAGIGESIGPAQSSPSRRQPFCTDSSSSARWRSSRSPRGSPGVGCAGDPRSGSSRTSNYRERGDLLVEISSPPNP